ncbi:MAG: VWA domain-containing protein [SAR324 cluster bacterium]|nr:VWA domain-containing protein [SAR324 cluster bacterium]
MKNRLIMAGLICGLTLSGCNAESLGTYTDTGRHSDQSGQALDEKNEVLPDAETNIPESEAVNSASGLKAEDFSKDYVSIAPDNIRETLKNTREFYNNFDSGFLGRQPTLTSVSDLGTCNPFVETMSFIDAGNGFYERFSADKNIEACLNQARDIETMRYVSSVHGFFQKTRFLDTEGSPVNLTTQTDLGTFPRAEALSRFYSKTVIHHITSATGETLEDLTELRQLTSASSSPDQVCVLNPGQTQMDCVRYTQKTTTQAGSILRDETTVSSFVSSNLTVSATGTYFTQGSIEFRLNNWTGTMTYSDDPETPPSFTVTNGSLTVTGKLGELNVKSLGNGQSFFAPGDMNLSDKVTGNFSGLTMNTGEQSDVVGFLALVGASSGETTGSAVYQRMITDIQSLTTVISQLQAVSVFDNGNTVRGSYSLSSRTLLNPTTLSNELLKKIGVTSGNQVQNLPYSPLNSLDYQTFRFELAVQYNSATEVIVIVNLVANENYTTYQAMVDSTVSVNNLVNEEVARVSQKDTFTVAATASVADFLMVIDNSGSMSDEQTALAENATSFFDKLQSAGLDFRIGVITTDSSTLRHTGFTNDKTAFQTAVQAGIGGSGTESAIYFAEQALLDTGSVVKAGYPRAGASLSIIMLSDESDQYSSYAGKAFDFDSNVFLTKSYKVYVIVADSGSSTTGYIKLASKTGGSFGNIYQSSYAATLDVIVQNAGGANYTLSHTPIASTLEVKVNGSVVPISNTNGFLYNGSANTIAFFGTAIPAAGATMEVRYQYVSR